DVVGSGNRAIRIYCTAQDQCWRLVGSHDLRHVASILWAHPAAWCGQAAQVAGLDVRPQVAGVALVGDDEVAGVDRTGVENDGIAGREASQGGGQVAAAMRMPDGASAGRIPG